MILICRNYYEDNKSYEDVIDWLQYRNASFKFFSGYDFYENDTNWLMKISNTKNVCSYSFEEVKSVWFCGFLRHRTYLSETLEQLQSTNDNDDVAIPIG
jgi:hypothetical protein